MNGDTGAIRAALSKNALYLCDAFVYNNDKRAIVSPKEAIWSIRSLICFSRALFQMK